MIDPAQSGSQKSGVDLIAAERERQVSAERWTPEHDDEHDRAQMARAAACYALTRGEVVKVEKTTIPPMEWPWGSAWWKPTGDAVRDLVKAGALIAAEIDRLQRGAS